jgi:hypothetical protein
MWKVSIRKCRLTELQDHKHNIFWILPATFWYFNLASAKKVVLRRTDVQWGGECRAGWKCFAQRFFVTSQKTWSFLSVSIIFKLYYIRSTRVFGNNNLIPFPPNCKLQTASCTGSVPWSQRELMRRCGRFPYVNAASQSFNIINITYFGFCQRRFGIFNLASVKIW